MSCSRLLALGECAPRWVSRALLLEPLALPLDRSNDRSEVLNLHPVCLRLLHVSEGQTEIIEGSIPVLITKAEDGMLQSEGAVVV